MGGIKLKKIAAILEKSGSKINTFTKAVEKGIGDPGKLGVLGGKVERISPAITSLAKGLGSGKGDYTEEGGIVGYRTPGEDTSVLYNTKEGTAEFYSGDKLLGTLKIGKVYAETEA